MLSPDGVSERIMDLEVGGKVALIPGVTTGIGRAIVEAFLSKGTHVRFCTSDLQEIAETESTHSNKRAEVADLRAKP